MSPIPGTGDFRPRRAGAFFAAFGGGEFARCGVRGENCCRAAAGGLQKGVQDTTKDVVSYTPSCDSP